VETIESKRIVLEELRDAFEKSYLASDTLDGKLQNVLNFSSVIVTIASTVLAALLVGKVGILFWVLLVIVMIVYFFTLVTIMDGLRVYTYSFPISMKMDTLQEKYFESTEDRALEQDILDHLYYIEEANKKNLQKGKTLDTSIKLLVLIVFLLFFSVPLGTFFH
jgi:hypothetical protein